MWLLITLQGREGSCQLERAGTRTGKVFHVFVSAKIPKGRGYESQAQLQGIFMHVPQFDLLNEQPLSFFYRFRNWDWRLLIAAQVPGAIDGENQVFPYPWYPGPGI